MKLFMSRLLAHVTAISSFSENIFSELSFFCSEISFSEVLTRSSEPTLFFRPPGQLQHDGPRLAPVHASQPDVALVLQ